MQRTRGRQAEVVREVATNLNNGRRAGRLPTLARHLGVSVDTARSWVAAASTAKRSRRLGPTARRLLFLLAELQARGFDLDELRRAARKRERDAFLEDSDD